MRKRAKIGDIFAQEVENGKFMFGRVLMDIEAQCFKSKIVLMDESNLKQFSISYIVEAYDVISNTPELPENYTTTIQSIVVNPMAFKYDTWKIIGNKKVEDISQVDFQEHCSFYNGKVTLSKGEVILTGELHNAELEGIDTGYQLNSPVLFDLVIELNKNPPNQVPLLEYDFRFLRSELRREIYNAIGEDPEMPYCELAMKHGFDTARFFKSLK